MTHLTIGGLQKCAVVPTRARILGSQTFVIVNLDLRVIIKKRRNSGVQLLRSSLARTVCEEQRATVWETASECVGDSERVCGRQRASVWETASECVRDSERVRVSRGGLFAGHRQILKVKTEVLTARFSPPTLRGGANRLFELRKFYHDR